MPFIRLESLGVGAFIVEAIDVGVYDAGRDAPEIQGLLGANFLGHFRFTVDRAQRQLSLER